MVVIGMPTFSGATVIYSENFESNLIETTDTTNGIVGYDSWYSWASPSGSYVSVAYNAVLNSFATNAQSGKAGQLNKIGRYLDTVNHTGLSSDAVTVMSFTSYAINMSGSGFYSHNDSIGLAPDEAYAAGTYWFARNSQTNPQRYSSPSDGLWWDFYVNKHLAGSFEVASGENSLVDLSIVVDGARNVVYGKAFGKDGTWSYTTREIGESDGVTDTWIESLNEIIIHQEMTGTKFNGVYLDTIQVSVPEPATLVLLGLGLLGLWGQQLRRRARA